MGFGREFKFISESHFMSPRRRSSSHDLPSRVYRKNGGIYFVDHRSKWHRLGSDWDSSAKALWVKLSAPGHTLKGSMSELIERYIEEVAPKKALRSFQENVRESRNLDAVFGRMQPESIKPKHVYEYLDKRGKKGLFAANREKAVTGDLKL